MAKKLKDFHQASVDALYQVQSDLKRYLSQIQTDQQPDPLTPPDYPSLLLAKARNKKWSEWLDRYNAKIKALRASLADESHSAADLETLAEQLRVLLIKCKATLSLINNETELIGELERAVAFIGGKLATVAADLSVAQDQLHEAAAAEERNGAWTDAIDLVVADDPDAPAESAWLKTIKDDAAAALNDTQGPFKTAQARVDGDIPEEVRLRAMERSAKVWDLQIDSADALSAMEDKADAKNKAEGGVAGAVAEKIRAFDKAHAALEALMNNAKSSYDIALAMLQAIVDSPAMSAAEQQRVNDLVTAALAVTPEEDIVFNKEQTRNEKRREVDEKRQELLTAKAIVRADDPDISAEGWADDTTVKPILDALGDDSGGLLKELQDAEDALGFTLFQELRDEELELELAIAAFEQAKVAFLKEHPDADPETDDDPAIADPRDERDAQQAVVDVKLTDFKQTAWYQLEEMEIAIPDRIWNNFKLLHAAEMRLQQLDDLPADLTDFKTELEIAEDELVTVLEAESASERGFDGLLEEIDRQSERLRWLVDQRETLLFDAARGID